VANTGSTTPSYTRTFLVLLVVDTVTLSAAYALNSNNNDTRNLLAVTLLAAVIIAQTVWFRPFLPILPWVSTIPVAVAMAYLIDANPELDWSGPCEADQICLAPIMPLIIVVYATGFAMIAGIARWACSALHKRYRRGDR
jgi:hypothetical protein